MLKLVANDGVDLDFMSRAAGDRHIQLRSRGRATRRPHGVDPGARSARVPRRAEGLHEVSGWCRALVALAAVLSTPAVALLAENAPDVAATVDRAFRDFESG